MVEEKLQAGLGRWSTVAEELMPRLDREPPGKIDDAA